MIKVKDGYAKLVGTTASGSASHILLSNGGIKAVSDFAMADGTNATGTWNIDISGNAKSSTLSKYLLTGAGTECDANTLAFSDHLLRWYSSIPSTSSNLPTVTGWLNGLLALPLHSNGVTAQLYFSATKALFYRSMASDDWHQIAYKTDILTKTSQLINDSGYVTGGPYLPLSGGTIGEGNSNAFPLKISSTNDYTGIVFANKNSTAYFRYLGAARWNVTNDGWTASYDLWHSGNDGSGSGLDADMLDGKHLSSFITYELATDYVGASFNSEDLAKKAASTYIEYWDGAGGWFNSRWGLVLAISGFHRVGSSDSYVLLGGGGHKALSDFAMASAYVKKAGDTMTGPLTISTANWGNLLVLNRVNNGENWGPSIIFKFDGTHNGSLTMLSNLLYVGDNGGVRYKAWHEGNDGSGSGLDADTVDSCHKDDFLRRTATLGYLDKFVLENIPKGVTQVGSIGWTDYQNYPYAGGLWMTLRGASSLSTALILFPSYSMSSPPILYSSIDGGAWQGGHQLAYTSQIPTTMAWGSITGKPSTFTPSTHYHNYFPENTAVYFRDPNNASWRGGMYWGSAGNESLCFVAVNANTSFRFFTGSDIANWTSSTWQGTPAFEVNKNGAYAPHFYESSDIRYKTIINNLAIKANQLANLPLFDFKWLDNEDLLNTGTSAQAVQELLPYIVSGTDKLTLDYGVLGTIAGITACRELTEQEKEINELKEQIKFLKDEINNLKTNKLWQS